MNRKITWWGRRSGKLLRSGEKGFTLIELLVVAIVLGALAVVVVPNAGTYLGEPKLSAANTEAMNVKTAALFALYTTGKAPLSSSELYGGAVDYLGAKPDGIYVFDSKTGLITSALASDDVGNTNPDEGITANLRWNEAQQSWQRK